MKNEQASANMARVLPRAPVGDRTYTIDLRLREFRTDAPFLAFIRFDSPQGRQLCRCIGVRTCLSCRTSFIAPAGSDPDSLLCPRCGSPVEGAKPL